MNDERSHRSINTVKGYNPIDDTWKRLPNMNFTRCRQEMVTVNKKLFVIGGGTEMNEVYDSTSGRFTVLKKPLSVNGTDRNNTVASFSFVSNLFIYFDGSSSLFS